MNKIYVESIENIKTVIKRDGDIFELLFGDIDEDEHNYFAYSSPSKQYIIISCNGHGYICLKLIEKTYVKHIVGEKVGKEVLSLNDEDEWLIGIEWYEKYGFVKLIFWDWNNEKRIVRRIYFDTEIYEKEKQKRS